LNVHPENKHANQENKVEKKKTMLITGASRGIGAATARLAAEHGYQVAINYRSNEQAAQCVAEDIRSAGGQVKTFMADVGDSQQVADLFNAVNDALGYIDVLVNNAGILETFPITEASAEAVETSFRANVFSLYFCAREAVKRMSDQHGGRGGVIINMSSIAARMGTMPGGNAYCASKAAVDGFNLALAHEVGGQGIRVNAIRPGIIATDIQLGRGGIEKAAEIAQATAPLKRIGQAHEVAQAVLWLASDAASYVHGATLDVSGGR
jgi:NAD(P)-dependent dehydrogenase (short-subunit alcohol dehydrogenase family)